MKEGIMSARKHDHTKLLKDVINREVFTISPTSPVSEAAHIMMNEDIGALVVVDRETRPVGMVTDRDLVVSVMAEGMSPDGTTVQDIMSGNLITVDEESDIFDMLSTLSENSIRRLPVTRLGKLTGIVSVDDLIVIVATELVNVAMALSSKSKML